jgi:integrase
MLRHWFATDMIQRGINPEIARRQLRHKNIETTMKIYVQVNNLDLLASVPQRPETIRSNSGQNTRISPHLRLIS